MFKKRKKGLMKKVSELSTLCGIESCAIIYSPYEAQPDVGPDARGAQSVVSRFNRLPEMDQSRNKVTQESLHRQRISKAAEQRKKVVNDNREKEITHLMYQCLVGKGLQGLGLPELNDMAWLIDQNLKEICKRIEGLKKAASPWRIRSRRRSRGGLPTGWRIPAIISCRWGVRLGMAPEQSLEMT